MITAGAGRAGHVQHRVTAQGHASHGAGHGIHGTGDSDHGDGERPAGPESTAASAAGAAAFTIPFQGLEGRKTPLPPDLVSTRRSVRTFLPERCGRRRERQAIQRVAMSRVHGRVRSIYCSCPGVYQPQPARGRLWPDRGAKALLQRGAGPPASCEPWSGCDARDLRWQPHGAATPSNEPPSAQSTPLQ